MAITQRFDVRNEDMDTVQKLLRETLRQHPQFASDRGLKRNLLIRTVSRIVFRPRGRDMPRIVIPEKTQVTFWAPQRVRATVNSRKICTFFGVRGNDQVSIYENTRLEVKTFPPNS